MVHGESDAEDEVRLDVRHGPEIGFPAALILQTIRPLTQITSRKIQNRTPLVSSSTMLRQTG